MRKIIKSYFQNFDEFIEKYEWILFKKEIGILSDFLKNKENVIKFDNYYINKNKPKIVLCGLNPGRLGAGLTGIPFIDFNSLSQMLPNIERFDKENSANFIFKIIQRFGFEYFYEKFYITNISKYGYYKIGSGKNINYPDLPIQVQDWLYEKFIDEMKSLNPDVIIPLSESVENSLKKLKSQGSLPYQIGERLNHPSWVMTYKKKEMDIWLDKYEKRLIDTLNKR